MATAPRIHPRRLSRLILVALCVTGSGCGGDDSSSEPDTDAAQIRAAVERLMESASINDQCGAGVSERFVREVYGTRARCGAANRRDADDADEPATASTSATRIKGERATTGVTLTSERGARAAGRLALVKVAGTWKVDRFGVDFLRSIFATLPDEAQTTRERVILECLAEATRTLSDREVRRVGNLLVGQQLEPESFPPNAVRCIRRGTQPTTAA